MSLAQYRKLVAQRRAADADGCLGDGTPYFGRIGEVAYDADEDLVQCHLCGEWRKWVGGLHLKFRHPAWTIDAYRGAFALRKSDVTMASSSRAKLRAITTQRLQNNELGSPLGGGHGLQRERWRALSECAPQLAGELHPTRNGQLDAGVLGAWSSELMWWRCAECGHEWQNRVASRTLGAGCPACGPRAAAIARRGKRAPMHQRSLAVLRPDLVAELHPSRNPGLDVDQVGVWSRRKVWWRCGTCATGWQALIMSRHQGSGCPKCAQQRRQATYRRNQTKMPLRSAVREPGESENAEHSTE